MTRLAIDSLEDPRLEPYRNLKDRELARLGDRFIAEGEHVVRRLLESDYPVESVLLAQRRAEELAPLVEPSTPVYVVPEALVEKIIGFPFHSGVLACGRRKSATRLEDVLPSPDDFSRPLTLLICPEIINVENMGTLIRISAAFGVEAMILGERSCDPFWRRAVRVSMGTIFRLPLYRSDDLRRDLLRLKEQWRVELAATLLDPDAQPLEEAQRPAFPDRLGLLLGSEAQGLHRRWTALCERKITIPMQMGTDSLNVAIAAAIFLHHFTRVAPRRGPAV